MKKLFIIFTLAVPFSCFAGVQSLTPESIINDIESRGAHDVVYSLYEPDDSLWYTVSEKIGTGNAKWLNVAKLIESGVDAGTSEDLKAMVALAIPHNPQGVLAILNNKNPILNIANICSFPNYPQSESEDNKNMVDSIRAMYKTNDDIVGKKECLNVMIKSLETSPPFDKDL